MSRSGTELAQRNPFVTRRNRLSRPIPAETESERRLLELGGGLIHSETRAVVRLLLYGLLTALSIPIQAALLGLRLSAARRFPRAYHRLCLRLLGFKVEVRGQPSARHPTLMVCNHASYLDIIALGSVIDCSFIAKSEVAGWPLFGLLAKLQRSVFVRRDERHRASEQADEIGRRLRDGDTLVLFPEGTSSDGNRVLPFKSALFQVADREIDGEPLTVQPVSIAYSRLNGVPIGRGLRPFFAWYGDMDLAPHLWHVVGLGQLTIEIRFHPSTTLAEQGSRKALARYSEQAVAAGVAAANGGRALP